MSLKVFSRWDASERISHHLEKDQKRIFKVLGNPSMDIGKYVKKHNGQGLKKTEEKNFILVVKPFLSSASDSEFILIDTAVEKNDKSGMFFFSSCRNLEDSKVLLEKMKKGFNNLAKTVDWSDRQEALEKKNPKWFFNPFFAFHRCLIYFGDKTSEEIAEYKRNTLNTELANSEIIKFEDFKKNFWNGLEKRIDCFWEGKKPSSRFGFDIDFCSDFVQKIAAPLSTHSLSKIDFDWPRTKRYWSVPEHERKGQRHRLKGVAGSGKSYIIAKRAVENAKLRKVKKILVTCYNITMANCLNYYVRTVLHNESPKLSLAEQYEIFEKIEFKHFHDLVPPAYYRGMSGDEALCNVIPSLWLRDLESSVSPEYDAVLIDEGQDFPQPMLDCLMSKKISYGFGDFLICGDPDQNLYDRKKNFFNERMSGFVGRLAELKTTHRLCDGVIEVANEFGRKFCGSEFEAVQQHQGVLEFLRPWFRWENFKQDDYESIRFRIEEILKYFLWRDKDLSADEIVFLVDTHYFGDLFSEFLQGFCSKMDWKLRHIFSDGEDKEIRLKKKSFNPLDYSRDDFKLVTVKSFKGWESKVVITIIEEGTKPKVALNAFTRARNNLFVINLNRKYDTFSFQKLNNEIEHSSNYNKNGFNRYWTHQNGTKFDNSGFDFLGFDDFGHDREKYDKKGFDKGGYDRDGYKNDGHDREGYDRDGYNRQGYDRDGRKKGWGRGKYI